jgi:DNA-binding transcriptional ArsR family regulator
LRCSCFCRYKQGEQNRQINDRREEKAPCVSDIALVLGLSVSALSHQLAALRLRRTVVRRKVGRVAYYRLVDDHLRRLVHDAATHVAEAR